MKPAISIVAAFSIILTLSGCKDDKERTDFSAICKSYFDDNNRLSPINATFNGQNEYNDQMTLGMTEDYKKQTLGLVGKYEKLLADVDKENLTAEEQISYDIISYEIKITGELYKFPIQYIPFDQFDGMHIMMPILASGTSAQPFKTEKDYRNFLKRMDRYTIWLDSAMVAMRHGVNKKIVLPKALTAKVIPQFDDVITEKAEDNVFYSSIKLMPKEFPEDVKKDLSQKYAAEINDRLLPKLREMSAFLKNEYLPASRTTSGIGSFPHGKKMYAVLANLSTTTDMTPDELHDLGLREVARIRKEMQKVQQQVGFKGTFNEFLASIKTNKELKPFTKPEQVIANFESIYARIKPNVDKQFSLQPKAKFEIRRTEAFREKTSSPQYFSGKADGSMPGIFYVPIPDVREYSTNIDEDLFLHEAIPGHHFQIMLQLENKSLPEFRKYGGNAAYVEGWAMYCETLGKELGVYTDPYQYFGMLSGDMHRAIRLVVDTGLHYKGWTREQAIRYSLDNEARTEASIIAEIERYMATPGQALAYKVGQMKILELRRRAEKKLGSKFDIREFHAKVLESGSLPLALLEQKINNWISKK